MKGIIIYIFFCVFSLYSCKKESLFDCVKGNGDRQKVEREIGDFNEIEINDIFNIYLLQDTIPQLMIEGGENLLPDIETCVKNGILKINNNNLCRWSRDYERINIWITVVDLKKINLLQPCYIKSLDTIRGENLDLFAIANMNEGNLMLDYDFIHFGSSHTTGGKITLSGKTNSILIECYNSLQLDALNLIANHIDAMNKSIGDIYIHCNIELKAHIYNSGNIYYKGDPVTIFEEIEGTGTLIKLHQ